MTLENLIKFVTGFITYGIPALSFLWQIKSDLSDKKQIESIISNYNYRNDSNFNFQDVSIQNGYIQINNPQSINIDLKNELNQFESERLEDKKFLSKNLYGLSLLLIFALFILNLIHNFHNTWDAFKDIPSIWDINKDVIIKNIALSFDKTLNQLLLMISIYLIAVVIKYCVNKYRVINTVGFILATLLYIGAYVATKQGFVQSLRYDADLSEFSFIISLLVGVVAFPFLFYSLDIIVARLFGLILNYKSKVKTNLVNNFSSISIVITPLLILIVKNFFR
ncbi:TPA: hypothetical protein TZS81_001901 [Streptococcus suis]|nr:hypothetical protein [Streptococcus suis]HEL2396767.1 hypothetical protein [Streptococcus suis]HEL9618487.1 hypothetical protein [Streptococcus suis]